MKSFFLILSVAFLTISSASAQGFSDIKDSDDEISLLLESGVVEGRSEGKYEPDERVTRAEMLKIILESRGEDIDEKKHRNCFPDVAHEWFAKYVCYGKNNGIISGYPDGFFRPHHPVNQA